MPIPGKMFSLLRGPHYAVEVMTCQKIHSLISPFRDRCFSNGTAASEMCPPTGLHQLKFVFSVTIARAAAADSTLRPSFSTQCEKLRLEVLDHALSAGSNLWDCLSRRWVLIEEFERWAQIR